LNDSKKSIGSNGFAKFDDEEEQEHTSSNSFALPTNTDLLVENFNENFQDTIQMMNQIKSVQFPTILQKISDIQQFKNYKIQQINPIDQLSQIQNEIKSKNQSIPNQKNTTV